MCIPTALFAQQHPIRTNVKIECVMMLRHRRWQISCLFKAFTGKKTQQIIGIIACDEMCLRHESPTIRNVIILNMIKIAEPLIFVALHQKSERFAKWHFVHECDYRRIYFGFAIFLGNFSIFFWQIFPLHSGIHGVIKRDNESNL